MATKRQKKPPAPEAAAPPEFDMSDPSSSSYGEGARFLRDMLDPSAFITDAGARVLHLADRTMAGLPEGGKVFLTRSRELVVRAMATIDSHDMPVEVRRAIDTLIRETSKITELKGALDTVQFELEHGPRERSSPVRAAREERRAGIQEPAIKTRRERILTTCSGWGETINTPGISGALAFELKVSESTIKSDLRALRKAR
jgi:hypothetical protein